MKQEKAEYFKEHSFDEWQELSFDQKRDIWNHYWNPHKPIIGKQTRDAIINEFKKEYPGLVEGAISIGYGYFGWGVGSLFIIVPKSSIRVPSEFASVMVNKGVMVKRIDKKSIMVNWRYGGTKAIVSIESDELR
jgi:hypothetical protein